MLEERMLYTMQDLFVNIRFFAYEKNAEKLKQDYESFEQQQNLIEYFSEGVQQELLLYCFTNLSELIETSDYQKIADFADAIHNLPEVFYKPYNLRQYWKTYIKPLNAKYNQKYFDQFKTFFKQKSNNIQNIDKQRRKIKKDEKTLYK